MAEVEVTVEVRSERRFLYQKISAKVVELRRLGMSYCAIADAVGVERDSVARALRWAE